MIYRLRKFSPPVKGGVFYICGSDSNIVRSIDMTAKKEYNYIYSEGSLLEAITYSIELNDEVVTRKTLLNTLRYVYDSEGKMTKKIITSADGASFVYNYETSDDKTMIRAGQVQGALWIFRLGLTRGRRYAIMKPADGHGVSCMPCCGLCCSKPKLLCHRCWL